MKRMPKFLIFTFFPVSANYICGQDPRPEARDPVISAQARFLHVARGHLEMAGAAGFSRSGKIKN